MVPGFPAAPCSPSEARDESDGTGGNWRRCLPPGGPAAGAML